MKTITVPALAELEERLTLNGIEADPCNVASALLGLASANEWNKRPDRFAEWLEQLAMDVLSIRKEPF
ncbi:MAG: hypothetical protein ACJ8FY_02560 [Gemmataceae bacterium]